MSDSKLDEAFNLIRQWHYETVREIADQAIEACSGRERIADAGVRSIYQDAIDEGREADAESILVGEREHGRTEIHGREREVGQDPHEFLTEWVDQATDDHNHVIYTYKAKALLFASDNEDAYEQEMGEAPSGNNAIGAQACMALRADVWELLNARDDEWKTDDEYHVSGSTGQPLCGAVVAKDLMSDEAKETLADCDECEAAAEETDAA